MLCREGVVCRVGTAHNLPRPRQPLRSPRCLVAVKVTDHDLARGGGVDRRAAPAAHQRHARRLEDIRVAAKAVVLLEDAQRKLLELRRLKGDNDTIRPHLGGGGGGLRGGWGGGVGTVGRSG